MKRYWGARVPADNRIVEWDKGESWEVSGVPCELRVPPKLCHCLYPPICQPYLHLGKECLPARCGVYPVCVIRGTCRFWFADLFMRPVGIKGAEEEAEPLRFPRSVRHSSAWHLSSLVLEDFSPPLESPPFWKSARLNSRRMGEWHCSIYMMLCQHIHFSEENLVL